jgi:hypothetical protein
LSCLLILVLYINRLYKLYKSSMLIHRHGHALHPDCSLPSIRSCPDCSPSGLTRRHLVPTYSIYCNNHMLCRHLLSHCYAHSNHHVPSSLTRCLVQQTQPTPWFRWLDCIDFVINTLALTVSSSTSPPFHDDCRCVSVITIASLVCL